MNRGESSTSWMRNSRQRPSTSGARSSSRCRCLGCPAEDSELSTIRLIANVTSDVNAMNGQPYILQPTRSSSTVTTFSRRCTRTRSAHRRDLLEAGSTGQNRAVQAGRVDSVTPTVRLELGAAADAACSADVPLEQQFALGLRQAAPNPYARRRPGVRTHWPSPGSAAHLLGRLPAADGPATPPSGGRTLTNPRRGKGRVIPFPNVCIGTCSCSGCGIDVPLQASSRSRRSSTESSGSS